jgi:uncharacterized protein (TIGR00255 family)
MTAKVGGMIYSMTAYTHQLYPVDQGMMSVELKSVNHRFLELTLKLSDELRYYETTIRQALAKLGRGKVECRLVFQAQPLSQSVLDYDAQRLEVLGSTFREIQALYPESKWPDLATLLQFPGVLKPSNAPLIVTEDGAESHHHKGMEAKVLRALSTAVETIVAVRAEEGRRIADLIRERVIQCRRIVMGLLESKERINEAYLERLTLRLEQLGRSLDQDKLIQEVTVQALRADVCEELDRLLIHLDTVDAVLVEGESVGKRLDFLMQELNREANTLASKAVDIQTSQAALQLKVYIEQMREQIQNLV